MFFNSNLFKGYDAAGKMMAANYAIAQPKAASPNQVQNQVPKNAMFAAMQGQGIQKEQAQAPAIQQPMQPQQQEPIDYVADAARQVYGAKPELGGSRAGAYQQPIAQNQMANVMSNYNRPRRGFL